MFYINNGIDVIKAKSYNDKTSIVSKFIRKQLRSNNLSFLLGSGCSSSEISLMGQTFDKNKEYLKNQFGEDILGEFEESRDVEAYLDWLNRGASYQEEFAKKKSDETEDGNENQLTYDEAFEFMTEKLLESVNHKYGIDKDIPEDYANFYETLYSIRTSERNHYPVHIHTTNYDLFNEMAMESEGIHYTNGFTGFVNRQFDPTVYRYRMVDDENRYKEKWDPVKKFAKLYKLHGSIDWQLNQTFESVFQKDPELISQSSKGSTLIYPTIQKYMETQYTPYNELMREFTNNLQKQNSCLIVIGYGFGDEHINKIIEQGLSNDDFNLIIFSPINPLESGAVTKGEEFIQNIYKKENVHIIGGEISNDKSHYFKNVIRLMKGGSDFG